MLEYALVMLICSVVVSLGALTATHVIEKLFKIRQDETKLKLLTDIDRRLLLIEDTEETRKLERQLDITRHP
jgi:hypothetical protein